MTADLAQSSRSKPVIRGMVATVLRSFVEIGAAFRVFFRASHPASAEKCTESSALETEAVATAQVPTHAEVEADAEICPVARDELDQREIERRRNLVRTLSMIFGAGRTKNQHRSQPGLTRPRAI